MPTFTDRTLVISGGSRGIGLAIALGAAKQGANVVLLAKTAEPHPKLPGTLHTAVADVEPPGAGRAVSVTRKERTQRRRHRDRSLRRIDVAINNASAIRLSTEELSAKFDLMMDINVRGTFLLTKAARAPAQVGEPPCGDPGSAAEHEPPLAGRPPDFVHVVEVRDDVASLGWAAGTGGRGWSPSPPWPAPTSRRRRGQPG
jgi:NAD(P)-dependent dehydrogenase (short-subunit alcohol dehydrogenase family)